MAILNSDFSIVRNSHFLLRLTLTDDGDAPLNLSFYTIKGSIKNKYSDTSALVLFNINVANAVAGIVDISLPSSVTKNLPITELVYDIEKYETLNVEKKEKVLKGRIFVDPGVTI